MPCDTYKQLAYLEKSNRQQYSYFTFNKLLAGVSEHKRKKLMKEYSDAASKARNDMYRHRQYGEKCKNEPLENFYVDD